MKKAKGILTIVFVSLIITVSLILLDSKCNMRHYSDDWKSETEDDTVSIINHIVYNQSGEELLDMDSVLPDDVSVVYCVKDERLYFGYRDRDSKNFFCENWHIASVSLSGENRKEHYSCNLFDESNKSETLRDLSQISRISNAEKYGGLYCNNQIYLHGENKTVVFDLETETAKEIDSMPESRYFAEIENWQTLNVKDRECDTSHIVTLESMARSNIYAKKLLELSECRTLGGSIFTQQLFSYVKIVDNQIYIACTVFNWLDDRFAVVFKYDYPSDTVYYVSSSKVDGWVDRTYAIAPKVVTPESNATNESK